MTTPSNYQNLGTDLDYSYVEANNPNYQSIVAAVSNRKTVMFGQQVISQTYPYPIGNLNNNINYGLNLLTPWVDQDATNIIGVNPTAVFYNTGRTTTGTTIRGQFNLLENFGQTTQWQYGSISLTSSPIQVGTATNWTNISAGFWNSNSAAGIQNGTLWTWGNNSWGQLGVGDTTQRSWIVQVGIASPSGGLGTLSGWSQISSRATGSTYGIQSNGTLWAWGNNTVGQLGNGGSSQVFSSLLQIGSLSTWSKVTNGQNFMLALQTNGTLWACGYNNIGQLGLSDLTNRSSPVQVGTSSNWTQISAGGGIGHALAVQSDGTMWAWGYNTLGQLGLSDLTNRSSPVQIGTISGVWAQVSAGYQFSMAIRTNGGLWAWGADGYGQLGVVGVVTLGYSSPIQISSDNIWSQISCGLNHTLAIQSNGTLWAWGSNSYGQLGVGSYGANILSPVQVGLLSNWTQVSAGQNFSVALQSPGTLWTWGNNSYGLGFTPSGISVNKATYGL